jgi:WD40 repeat protein
MGANRARMRLLHISSLFVMVSLGALAGCSSSSTLGTPNAASAGVAAVARDTAGLIYASSFGGNTVDYYKKGTGPNNPVAGSLSGSLSNPWGMAVDKSGDLYVANSGDQNVLVYAKGSTSPTRTLTDSNKFPCDVALGSDGTVYVANGDGPVGASGNVVIYKPGASLPTQTLTNGHFQHVTGVALDKAGNVFVAYNAQQAAASGGVVEFHAPKFTNTTNTHIKLEYAGGVGFDGQGHLLVIDQKGPTLNVYNAGKRKPVAKLTLPGASWFFAFNQDSTQLYVADSQLGEIDVFRYTPTALKQVNKITNGESPSQDDFGVVDTPPQQL